MLWSSTQVRNLGSVSLVHRPWLGVQCPLWPSPFSSIQIGVLLTISCANGVRKCYLFLSGVLPRPTRISLQNVKGNPENSLNHEHHSPGIKIFIITIALEISWHQVNLMFWLLLPAELSGIIKSSSTSLLIPSVFSYSLISSLFQTCSLLSISLHHPFQILSSVLQFLSQ